MSLKIELEIMEERLEGAIAVIQRVSKQRDIPLTNAELMTEAGLWARTLWIAKDRKFSGGR